MIHDGSTVVLMTKDAVYSTCKIISINAKNITIAYYTCSSKFSETGEIQKQYHTEVISRKNIVSMSERI